MKLKSTKFLLAASMAAMLAPIAPAMAQESRHETRFKVKYLGLTLGQATFGIKLKDRRYAFSIDGTTRGIAKWFASGKATIRSDGLLKGRRINADRHFVQVTEGGKSAVLKITYDNGTVSDVHMKPDKRRKRTDPKRYVVVKPNHLKDVIDPASAVVVPVDATEAKNPTAVCERLIKVYDGETRFNIKLSYKANKKLRTEGYDGWAYVCRLKYIPIAGQRIGHRSVKRMAANNDMEIWLAPVDGGSEDTAVFTVIRILVPTWIGTFSAEPQYFGPAGGS